MRPRPGLQDVVLVDDGDGDDQGGDSPVAESDGADAGRARRFVRRWRWPVAGVVVLALVSAGVVASRRDAARLADLAGVPGILAPLDGRVRELWTTADFPFPTISDLGGVLVGATYDMVAFADPQVRGVEARTGEELWSMPLGGQPGGSRCVPAAGPVAGPRQAVLVCVVVDAVEDAVEEGAAGSSPGETTWRRPTRVHLAVLDPRTGRVLREQPAAPDDWLVAFGTDVVRTSAGEGGTDVTRLDPRTGEAVWTSHHPADSGELVQSGYAVTDGDGLLVSAGSRAWLLSSTGELVDEWEVATDDGWSLFQAGGHVLRAEYASNASGLVLTDLVTGVRITPPEGSSPWPGVDDGSMPGVLFTSGLGLAAWDLGTGERRWQREGAATGAVDGAFVLDGAVYTVGDGVVSALDGASGKELWTVRTGLSGPYDLATDGRSLLVLGSASGSATSTVRALDLTDGRLQWDAPLTHPMQSLEVSAGHLFAQTDEGVFVALG
ncbi:PQQ-binding-like beta-propeller repeat protein [Pengzhenrongella frigida]|uniref:Pyrrolo-quinoline quinone repeat domain-containing protein n=1 Tax=Pengzhenrongella frigida TaxID=1259133 RepID=A0A4Q5N250_9MICO|nr:PQQ-binding-like beta-propeller repeat protein [Cellulomonas sp. HLT2-17]RYV52200.1 hypothetical protein EUA98_04310 [Cellulomonas sp. HLT2-17]